MSEDETETQETESEQPEAWDLLSEALGSLDELEDDGDVSIDVREHGDDTGAEQDPFTKISLANAEYLIKLRSVVASLVAGEIAKEQFLAQVRPVATYVANGVELMNSETVTSQVEELPEEEAHLINDAVELFGSLSEGLKLMTEYFESNSIEEVQRGMQIIEEAFLELDEVQDEAIEIGREVEIRNQRILAAEGDSGTP